MRGSACYGFEPYAPDLLMRPVARIIRELPPSLAAYRVRFPSAPPRLGCLLSCGVRLSSETKKAVTTALGRNPLARANACVTAFTLLLSTTTNSLYHKKVVGGSHKAVFMKQPLELSVSALTRNTTNTAWDCLARMALVTANHNPNACWR